ncbi:hypothetical protein ACF0H5_016618 [Mactra antiquata]
MDENRASDIIIIGYQYSGTDVLEKLIRQLTEVPSPYNNKVQQQLPCYHGNPAQYDDIPVSTKVIFIIRNIKDIAVNLYKRWYNEDPTHFEDFLINQTLFSDTVNKWCDHIKEWKIKLSQHPTSNLHLIYYTDLIKNCEVETKKLCEFLNVRKDNTEIMRVSTLIMKEEEQPQRKRRRTDHNHDSISIYDEDGIWKQYFTVSQKEQVDSFLTNLLQTTNIDIIKLLS